MKRLTPVLLAVCTGLLSACGGGSGDATPSTPTTVSTTVSGTVVKGPVGGSTVCAYKLASSGKGEQLACTTSAAGGGYTLSLQYTGHVVIEASGGSYTDEATGATATLAVPMQVVVNSQGGATTGIITPLTAVAYSIARTGSGGLSSASFASATASVATLFQLGSVDITASVPTVTGSTDLYGRVLRAVSQYLANGGNLQAFINWTAPASFQAAFAAAYVTINGSSITFNFGATSGGPGTGGTGTGGTGTGGGTRNLVIQVSISGAPSSTINVGNVPAPTTQSEFCSGIQSDTSFQQISQGANGTLTINSCSFSGSTGTIQATLAITSPIALTVPYTVTYTYQ